MQKASLILASFFLILITGALVGFAYSGGAGPTLNREYVTLAQAKQATGPSSSQSAVQNATKHNELGLAEFQKGNYDEAIRHFDEAIKVDPKNVNAFNNRGVVYSRMGKYDKAVSDFNKAMRLDPKFAQAYENRSIANFRAKNYSKACSDLEHFRQMGGTPSPGYAKDLSTTSHGKC